MNLEFIRGRHTRCDMLSWLGEPMIYDYGLFVNRTIDEHIISNTERYKTI